jgi:hypothetical protein
LYEIRVDPEHECVHLRFHERLKAADLTEGVRALVEVMQDRPGTDGIVDLLDVTAVEVYGEDVRAAADIVASTEHLFAYGLSRQYQMVRDIVDALRIFRSMDQARAWLGLSS